MPPRVCPLVAPLRKARIRCRGLNALAELEALCVLGGGSFELGVHHAANLFRRLPLAERSGQAFEAPFGEREDRRHWAWPLYEEDAYLLRHLAPSATTGLSLLLAAAWPHVGASYRERIDARLTDLPDDALARAWSVRAQPRRWAPPRTRGEQTHFVILERPAPEHGPDSIREDLGVRP